MPLSECSYLSAQLTKKILFLNDRGLDDKPSSNAWTKERREFPYDNLTNTGRFLKMCDESV